MSIPRFSSRPSMFFVGLALSALFAMASVAQAQKQASCTFTFFTLGVNIPNLGPGFMEPSGINDFGTIVGLAMTNNESTEVGFIRWANGGLSFPLGTSATATSVLFDRNDSGTTIAFQNGTPVLLNGTTITGFNLGVNNNVYNLFSINNWGSIVGNYFTDFPNDRTGFKRWSNGGFFPLFFPGNLPTTATGINDQGTVVGYYSSSANAVSGFIYHGGDWAALNFPNATSTYLAGISNAGVIIGNADVKGFGTPFLYKNGVFKLISVPNALANTPPFLLSISPKLGLIVGMVGTPNQGGFIAKCN